MSKRRSAVLFAICLVTVAVCLCAIRAVVAAAPTLAEADKFWGERSYAQALEGYQAALATGGVGARQAEIEYRVAVSLGRSQKWDDALERSRAFVQAHPDGLWGARGTYWLGQLLVVVPHGGYRVGERIYRGDNYPKVATAEKPERVYLQAEDRKEALAAFEKAKGLYEGLRPDAEREEADLNFDLARLIGLEDTNVMARALAALEREKNPKLILRYGEPKPEEVEKLRNHNWEPTPTQSYDAKQPAVQRVLGLYLQIETLDQGTRAPQARLARTLYLNHYQQTMKSYMRVFDEGRKIWVDLPFPYQDADPLGIMRSVADDFPTSDVAPQAQGMVGRWLEQKGDFLAALEAYRKLVERWPKSKWVSDAQGRIQEIEWPSVRLSSLQGRTGQAVTMNLRARNVKTIKLTAYRVRLEKLLQRPDLLNNPSFDWRDLEHTLGTPSTWRSSPVAATWEHATADQGEHKWLEAPVKIPFAHPGAYVVEADSGPCNSAALLLITDLAIVEKGDKDRAIIFVCDAKSGRPVGGAEVLLREIYERDNKRLVNVQRGQTGPDGLATKWLIRGRGIHSNRAAALVWVGDRYAVTDPMYEQYYWRDNRDEYRAYTYTDRPVFRPGQRVNFRAVLTVRHVRGDGGETPVGAYQPAANLTLEVTVRSPRRDEITKRKMTTSEFGSINGSFELDQDATLGEYTIRVLVPQSRAAVSEGGANRFRVEEYKKPEFEVTVTPSASNVRLGQPFQATVKASYYFGSPVVAAQVKYRIFRRPFYPQFHFPRPYDWLLRYWQTGDYGRGYSGGSGELVTEGDGRTDGEGLLKVTIAPPAGGGTDARGPVAYTYSITAEVTDESRRTISGDGEVRASKQKLFAFLDLKRGFYQADDRIEVELATRDVMERPVAAKGRMKVERVVKAAPGLVEKLVLDRPITIGKEGRAFFHWTPKEAGQYQVSFEATDEWEQKVSALTHTWVHGPGMSKAAFRLNGIQLIPERQTYVEGATCKLLIVTDTPDCTVLLTQEAGTQILSRQVLAINGKARVIEAPIGRNHVPSFHFRAIMIREWTAHEHDLEIFVPAARQFLKVAVSGDRAHYRPGDKATFRVKATDWRGKPARAELSLGVVDASLYYIQKEYAPDPRLFFYGERRYPNTSRTWSLYWQPQGTATTALAHNPYTEHEWRLPEGMGQLEDWPPEVRGSFGYLSDMGDYSMGRMLRDVPMLSDVPIMGSLALKGRLAGGMGGVYGPSGEHALMREENSYGRPLAAAMLPPPAPRAINALAAQGYADRKGALAEAQVRTRFADTAFWSPAVVTGRDGTASVTVTMPENLTTWRAVARGFTTTVQVGEGSAEAITRKNLIARLQAPRFFMERDLVALSANVHNYLKSDKQVKVTLALDGGVLELVKDVPADLGLQQPATAASLWITVPKNAERRVDWVVRVVRPGAAKVRMTAQSDEESDAIEQEFPALVHGVEKFEAHSGVARDIKGTQTIIVKLDVPRERRRGATELNLLLTPSLASVALDSLPYLADYPYGCIEQTMSRFMPSVVVARTLSDLGVNLGELKKRADAYAHESKAGGKGQPDSGYTYPKGMPGSFKAAALTASTRPDRSPIFDPAELDSMVKAGLRRIYSMQHPDGGWGWWPNDVSDPYMTAYVCYGLWNAKQAGREIDAGVLERGHVFLIKSVKEDDNLHRMAYLASVVTLIAMPDPEVKAIITDRLYRNRMKLSPYSQALLALALKQMGQDDKARILLDNLESTASIDRDNGTCNWMPRARGWWWWHWWDNPVETNAAVLRATLAIRPDSELAPMIVKWIVNNRRGNHWGSTKATAMVIYGLADYIRVKKELAADYTVTVDFGGKVQRTYRVNRENALFFDNRFIVGDEVIGDGAQTLTITVKGSGTLYYSAYLKYFSLQEDIKGGGNEIFVQRRYFKLTPKVVEKTGGARTWQELAYDRAELPPHAQLRSGDLIEVELVIDAKNDYEYVMFEDMKPAGCEPVEVRSGYSAGEGAGVWPYVELRDEKVALFLSNLPQGTRALRYRLRAEIPGAFHVLPTNGYSMYAPDVRCLSDERRVEISD